MVTDKVPSIDTPPVFYTLIIDYMAVSFGSSKWPEGLYWIAMTIKYHIDINWLDA